MLLASLSYYVIRFISLEITDSLGIYLYLLASGTVVSAVFTGKRITTLPAAGAWALRYTGGFALAAVVISAIREVLAYGTLWGFARAAAPFRCPDALLRLYYVRCFFRRIPVRPPGAGGAAPYAGCPAPG